MRIKEIKEFKKEVLDNENFLKEHDIFVHLNFTEDYQYFSASIYYAEDCNSEAVEEAVKIRSINELQNFINIYNEFLEEVNN